MNVQVTAYLPNCFQVTFPLMVNDQGDAFQVLSEYTTQLKGAGFLAAPPALGEGEATEEVGYVLRRQKDNDDNTTTTVIDLYPTHEQTVHRFLQLYLNTDEQAKAFESATGLTVAKLPLFVGDKLERDGKSLANQYIVKLSKPAAAIVKANPKYNPEEPNPKNRKPKRLFVRWDGVATNTPAKPQNAANSPSDATTGDAWDKSAVETLIAHYAGKLDVDQIKIALGVKERFGEWTKGKQAAYQAVEAFRRTLELDFNQDVPA